MCGVVEHCRPSANGYSSAIFHHLQHNQGHSFKLESTDILERETRWKMKQSDPSGRHNQNTRSIVKLVATVAGSSLHCSSPIRHTSLQQARYVSTTLWQATSTLKNKRRREENIRNSDTYLGLASLYSEDAARDRS
ncbi:hypothetical protein Bbelb_365010 [Branchiostoma belcheri]|nr:hypothetical protein Bbelb_365010 [Branchiostoma belcheri]